MPFPSSLPRAPRKVQDTDSTRPASDSVSGRLAVVVFQQSTQPLATDNLTVCVRCRRTINEPVLHALVSSFRAIVRDEGGHSAMQLSCENKIT